VAAIDEHDPDVRVLDEGVGERHPCGAGADDEVVRGRRGLHPSHARNGGCLRSTQRA
jgi:hypothetical protein